MYANLTKSYKKISFYDFNSNYILKNDYGISFREMLFVLAVFAII